MIVTDADSALGISIAPFRRPGNKGFLKWLITNENSLLLELCVPQRSATPMKSLLFLLLLNALFAGKAFALIPCHLWQERLDQTMKMSGPVPLASEMSSEEKMHAISCLLALEGNKAPSRVFGQTGPNSSQIVPQVNVEIAALFFIRYIYYGDWAHCGTIALREKEVRLNTKYSVKKAYASYKQWFALVKQIGLEKSMERGLDPMDGCLLDEVRWDAQDQWEELVERRLSKAKELGHFDAPARTTEQDKPIEQIK